MKKMHECEAYLMENCAIHQTDPGVVCEIVGRTSGGQLDTGTGNDND